MAFPGPYASIIKNDAGEVIGWDNYYPEDAPYEPTDEDERRWEAESAAAEDAFEFAEEEGATQEEAEEFSRYRIKHGKGKTTEQSWFDWRETKEAKLT
jgi:hypothetical protein